MKSLFSIIIFTIFLTAGSNAQSISGKPGSLDNRDTWTVRDLMKPADLAGLIAKGKKPVILNIGVVDDIKGAKNVGAASQQAGLNKLRTALSPLPKSSQVIIYCGCCPFEKCPNIRPAFNLMKSMGFVNGRLLDLPVNLKQNWIDKGYPIAEK